MRGRDVRMMAERAAERDRQDLEAARAALLELATAMEYHAVWQAGAHRARTALTAAWKLVDTDGSIRARLSAEAEAEIS